MAGSDGHSAPVPLKFSPVGTDWGLLSSFRGAVSRPAPRVWGCALVHLTRQGGLVGALC